VVDSAVNLEKIEAVDVAELMAEFNRRHHTNENNRVEMERLKEAESDLSDCDQDLLEAKADLEAAQKRVIEKKGYLRSSKADLKLIADICENLKDANEQEIKDQIENAQGINLKATAYEQFRENEAALEDIKLDYEGKNDMLNVVASDRINYLKSLNLPWPNITITDEGEFRLNDKPFCAPYFSTGEILKFGARIGSKLKDGLKYVFFPSSNVMDDKNREATIKTLVDDGFQVVLEFISDKKIPEENCILLKELKVVDSYDTEKNGKE